MDLEFKTSGIYPQAVAIIALSGTVMLLDISPFFWHLKHKNFPACSITIWIILVNLMNFINAIIWPNDNMEHWFNGHGLCDVESKLIIGSWVGLTGALACMLRSLTIVMNTKKTVLAPSRGQQRFDLALNIIFCWGFPVVEMGLHYIVQPNRYYIVGISGCVPSVDNSWVGDVLIFIWPPILSLVDTYYALLLLYRIHRYRAEFNSILRASNTTKNRFLRLTVLCTILLLVFLPLQIFTLVLNLSVPRLPYSWAAVHPAHWTVKRVPSFGQAIYDQWIDIGVGALVFAVFGANREAYGMYKGWAEKSGISWLVSRSRASVGSAFASGARLVSWRGEGKGSTVADTATATSMPRSSLQSEDAKRVSKESYVLPLYAKESESAEQWSEEVKE